MSNDNPERDRTEALPAPERTEALPAPHHPEAISAPHHPEAISAPRRTEALPAPQRTEAVSRPAAPAPGPTGSPVGAPAAPPAMQQPEQEPERLRGPSFGPVILGLVCLLIAGAVFAQEIGNWTIDWGNVGPLGIVAAGAVLVILGAVGLATSRRRS